MSVVGIMANIMANSDNDKAIENTKRANEIVERAKQLVEKAKAECQNSMICLDCEKREVLEGTLNTFSVNFRRIAKTKKINFAAGSYLTEIGKFSKNELGRMHTFTTQASGSSNKNNSLGLKIGGAVAKSALKKVKATSKNPLKPVGIYKAEGKVVKFQAWETKDYLTRTRGRQG